MRSIYLNIVKINQIMNKDLILRFIKKFYKDFLYSKYKIDLDFTNVKIIGSNIIIDVNFPDDLDVDTDVFNEIWEKLYKSRDFIDTLGYDIKSLNFNPIFNFTDEDDEL